MTTHTAEVETMELNGGELNFSIIHDMIKLKCGEFECSIIL